MKKETYVVLDIETTGLSKHHHKITEIAAVKVQNNKILKEFSTLINPEVKIPSFITSLTGINNKMVKNSPTIEEVIPKFMKFLGKNPFVAHCATFDYGFLKHNAQQHLSIELTNSKICTAKLSRRLVPELTSHKLSSLCEHFKIENNLAHRAISDVHATNQIFTNLLNILEKNKINERQQILTFQDSRISRI